MNTTFEYGLGHTPVSFTQDGQRYYIQTDHLGSPRVVSSTNGSVVKAISYDSYGNVISDSNPAFHLPFGFAGGLYDADSQLIRFGYRDYDPQTGRWTARDLIGFAGGDTNLYGYVLGDPVNFIDLDGLFALPVLPQGVVNAAAGFGDALSFGLTDVIRDAMDTNGAVNKCASTYSSGKSAGYVISAVGGGAVAARALGWSLTADRYKNAGGVGINLYRNGKRKFGIDWHKFKHNEKTVNRPHYHRGATNSQMKKHRPWQGGW